MELDEMKQAWQGLDRRLEQQETWRAQVWRESRLDKLRHGLRPLLWGQAIQLAFGVLFTVLGMAFWASHLQVTHLLVCGVLVQVFGLCVIGFSARTLQLIERIDYAAPVLTIQRELADLRRWRVRIEAPINAVLGCFVWIVVLWMNLAWYGVDLWSAGFIRWALLSGLVGIAAVMLTVWLARRLGLMRKLEDGVAGRSVQKAEAVLDEFARFEQE